MNKVCLIGSIALSASAFLLVLASHAESGAGILPMRAQTIDSTTYDFTIISTEIVLDEGLLLDDTNILTTAEEEPIVVSGESAVTTSTNEDTDTLHEEEVPVTETLLSLEARCPFTDGTSIVISFDDAHKRSVDIKKGLYAIALASAHVPESSRTTANLHERWFLELRDAEGFTFFKSNYIRDIRDDEAVAVELVNGTAVLSRDARVGYVRIDSDAETYQQFRPLCASLRYIGEIESPIENKDTVLETETVMTNGGVMETAIRVIPPASATQKGTAVPQKETLQLAQPEARVRERLSMEEVQRRREIALRELDKNSLFDALQVANSNERKEFIQKIVSSVGTTAGEPELGMGTVIELNRNSTEELLMSVKYEAIYTETALEALRLRNRREVSLHLDSDGDGITDYDEQYVYKTNPKEAFTSGGILSDGERVLLGLNPVRDDLITVPVESPKLKGEIHSELFAVREISYAAVQPESAEQAKRTVRIIGESEPLVFVTLFVYSTPIIVTVRADEKGTFVYTLDETLEDGSHELYVASVNNSGKILAKSDAIPFVKTAQAIEYFPVSATSGASPVHDAMRTLVTLSFLLLLLISIGTTVFLGYLRSLHEHEKIHAV